MKTCNAKPFKRRWTEPVPSGAKLTTIRGRDIARWRDDGGRMTSAPVVTAASGKHKGELRIVCESDTYYGRYRDGQTGKVRCLGLDGDYEVACVRLRELRTVASRERAGLALPAERRQQEAIDEHLAEFERVLSTTGRHRRSRRRTRRAVSPSYLHQTMAQIRDIVRACGFVTLEQIEPAPVARYVAGLTMKPRGRRPGKKPKARETRPLGPKSRNAYLDAIHGFVHWSVESGLLPEDRLASLPMYDQSEDVRRKRRALTPDEAAALIRAAAERPAKASKCFVELAGRELTDVDRGLIGLEHALWWKWSILTGIRSGETAGLSWADVDLDGAHVFVSSKLSKNHNDDYVALRSDLVADLKRWRQLRGNPGGNAPLFALGQKPIRIFKRDLKAAGVVSPDAEGRQIDVHALRTTCATWLSRVALKSVVAQHLRHGKSGVTDANYIRLGLRDTREAVEKLPELPIPGLYEALSLPLAATGTDGRSMYTLAYTMRGRERSQMAPNVPLALSDPIAREQPPSSRKPRKTSCFQGSSHSRPQRESNSRLQDENLIS